MLGDMSIDEMQKRSGVIFPEPLVEYMDRRRQQSANEVAAGKWHCFDIPFMLVCGDMETATVIHSHLAPMSSDFDVQLDISITGGAK
jgi:hypothetical protein